MEPEKITCEDCGGEHKSKYRLCPVCGYDRFKNPDDGRYC